MSHIMANTDEDVLVIKIDPASLKDFDLSFEVENEIDEAFKQFNTKNAVIDLQNIKLLQSVGLRIFVRLLQKAKKRSGRVILCNATGAVEDVLSLSKIAAANAVLALVADREEAIAAIRSIENL